MILEEGDINEDEKNFLTDHFHGLKKLTQKDRRYLELDFRHAAWCTLQIEACVFLCIISCVLVNVAFGVLCGLACLAIIIARCAIVAVLGWSVLVGKLYKPMYRRSVLYWSYWPCIMLPLCVLGAVWGLVVGELVWHEKLHEYYQLERLQIYRGVDPATVPGQQVQDVGIATFSVLTSIDRSKGGCLVAEGHTYCVAPILHNGELLQDLADAPRFGSYDYFAVGMDCCNCPNQDFRCGEYMNPLAHGGTRSMDYKARPFYQLAVDSWKAVYGKASDHPLFFDWKANPEYHWEASWYQAVRFIVLGLVLPIPACFILIFLLQKVLTFLEGRVIVSKLDTPAPPLGMEKAWEWWLPDMRQQYLDEPKQLLGLPTTPMPSYAAALLRGHGAPAGQPLPPAIGAGWVPDGTQRGAQPGDPTRGPWSPVSVY